MSASPSFSLARTLLPVLVLVVLSAACGGGEEGAGAANDEPVATEGPLATVGDAARREPSASARQGGRLQVEAAFGDLLYERNCAVCHGRRGGGDVGPALAGNTNLANQDYVVARILLGGGGMPPFAPHLTAAELGAVGSYVRTSWGNDFGSLSPEEFEVQWFGLRLGEPPVGLDAAEETDAEGDEEADARTVTSQRDRQQWGADLYANVGCVGCHSAKGAGGIGPPLNGNPELRDEHYVVHKILHGGGGMPAFDTMITDEQVAAIATHVRTAWTNGFGAVDGDAVARHSGEALQRREGEGERIFDRAGCAGCHGSQGEGGVGPALDGNLTVRNRQYVLTQVLYGGGGMPAFADRLSDEEIADVATHVRTGWRNDFGAVATADVAQQREVHARQAEPSSAFAPRDGAPDGARIYTLRGCGGCHGENGGGGVGPALAGNPNVANTKLVVTQILHGGGGMPPFAKELSSDQLAAVASHVRTTWGNQFGEVTTEQVDMLGSRRDRAAAEGD